MRFQINQEDIKELVERFKAERSELGKVINPIIEKFELEKKEVLEVCQIGKFVYKIDTEIQIIDKPQPPNPDFLIKYNNSKIGLEHTRLLTKDASRYFKIVTLLEYAEDIFRKNYPKQNIHASISFKNDKLEYKQIEKGELAEKISLLVYSSIIGAEFELPDFITNLRTGNHSQVTFIYNERNWQGPYLTLDRLEKEIHKKENKISNYKTSKDELSQFWLVLLVGSLNSVSYQLNNNLEYKIKSKFDRVYLMADYDAKIIRVD